MIYIAIVLCFKSMNLIVSDESEFEARSSEIVESEKIVLQFIKNNWNSQTEYNQLSGIN